MKAFNGLDFRFRIHVLKIGPDRPVGPSIGHKIGPIQCKKPFFDRTKVEPIEPAVEPVVEQAGSLNFFFQVKTTSF